MTRTYLSLAVFSALLMPLDAGAADLAVTAPPTISYVPSNCLLFRLGRQFQLSRLWHSERVCGGNY
jgi:hypothetical protein